MTCETCRGKYGDCVCGNEGGKARFVVLAVIAIFLVIPILAAHALLYPVYRLLGKKEIFIRVHEIIADRLLPKL
jgi:hypothetical protein